MTKRVIQPICDCGCSRLTVPCHLGDAELWVSVTPYPGQETVRFTLTYEPEEPDDKGWRSFMRSPT